MDPEFNSLVGVLAGCLVLWAFMSALKRTDAKWGTVVSQTSKPTLFRIHEAEPGPIPGSPHSVDDARSSSADRWKKKAA